MYITARGCRLRNDLYCVEWDVKLYYTIPYHTTVHLMTFDIASSPSRTSFARRTTVEPKSNRGRIEVVITSKPPPKRDENMNVRYIGCVY